MQFFALVLVIGLLQAPAKGPEFVKAEEHWFTLALGGTTCGSSHILLERAPAAEGAPELFRTWNETDMKLGRAGASVQIRIAWEFIEDASGKPVSCSIEQATGGPPMRTAYRFLADGIEATTTQGSRTQTQRLPPLPGEWMPPHAAEAYANARREAGEAAVTVKTVDPSNGLRVITVTSARGPSEEVAGCGPTETCERWTVTNDLIPIPATEWYDAKGDLVKSVTKMALGDLSMCRSDESGVRGAGRGPAPELIVNTFTVPDKPISDPRGATRIAYTIRTADGSAFTLPSAGAQSVSPGEGGALLVVMDEAAPSAATPEEMANDAYRRATPFLDTGDPRVRALAERALRGKESSTQREKAGAMRAFVREYISEKDLSTAFASASEIARNPSGDCSEHAVLLAALLRSAGIPSRVCAGLVYADSFAGHESIFGWHMWTQALIDGRWIDLDGTLPVDFDAAHILAATSAQELDAIDPAFAAMVGMVGNLSIEVGDVRR